jgi:hypothetical protein
VWVGFRLLQGYGGFVEFSRCGAGNATVRLQVSVRLLSLRFLFIIRALAETPAPGSASIGSVPGTISVQ